MSDPSDSHIANDLLTALKYKEYPNSIRSFLFDAAYEMEALMELQPDPRSDYDAVVAGFENLIALLKSHSVPNDYFDIIAYGYNKECYSFSPHFVIKFCARRNPTLHEQELLLDAFYENLDEMFLPSRYVDLPWELPSEILEKEEEEEYDYETDSWYPVENWEDNTAFNAICFQPRISELGRDDAPFMPKENWEAASAAVGIPVTEQILTWDALGDTPTAWVAALVNHFGIDQARRLAGFCRGYRVYDLHGTNVGYLNSIPVILDWLSN